MTEISNITDVGMVLDDSEPDPYDACGHRDVPLAYFWNTCAACGASIPPSPRYVSRLFTPEITREILDSVRAGTYLHVACRAVGISKSTLGLWLTRPEPEFQAFAAQLDQAAADARRDAEMRVKAENPLAWLMKGPGRERPGDPGWADASKVELTGQNGGPVAIAPVLGYDLKKLADEDFDHLDRITTKALPEPGTPAPSDPSGDREGEGETST